LPCGKCLADREEGVMGGVTPDEQQLLNRIADRRRSIEVYLSKARPRSARLTLITIVSSALAAVLTAGPAIGGQGFTEAVAAALNLEGSASVWRPLCLLATIVSVVAAISANLSRSKNVESRIVSAETANSELEGLLALIEFNQVPLKEAVKMYQQIVTRVPFVPEEAPSKETQQS
jgi:hypothetical protein